MARFMVAAIQMTARPTWEENMNVAGRFIEAAANRGARIVVLPEMFTHYSSPREMVSRAEKIPGHTTLALSHFASEHDIYLVGGTFYEKAAHAKAFNTCVVFNPSGGRIAVYRKIHLFDVSLPDGTKYRESDFVLSGDEIVTFSADGFKCGVAICYDLRFPELFRSLSASGACVILVPSAFTLSTGRDHWEVLLRARAIENQCYIVGANQTGQNQEGLRSCGRSMIVDPWGVVIAQASDTEQVVLAEIDTDYITHVRTVLPALQHRKLP